MTMQKLQDIKIQAVLNGKSKTSGW